MGSQASGPSEKCCSKASSGQDDQGIERPDVFRPPEHVSDSLSAITWNVAAVNLNPFEYWLDYGDPGYLNLMTGVEGFLREPGCHDVIASEIFTEPMFQELKALMLSDGMTGVEEVERTMWRSGDLRLATRKVVSEFIKDGSLGTKRLISMPDRCTNTIFVVTQTESLYQPPPVCRPCVINNFEGDLSSVDVWWEQWKSFMFDRRLTVRTKTGVNRLRPVDMLEDISKNKYPAITSDEERLNRPLQLICMAIFDAVLVHLLNRLSPGGLWQTVKARIYDKLFRGKTERTFDILTGKYAAVDVICLQEVAAVFQDRFPASELAKTHILCVPSPLEGTRDQNSMVLLRRERFAAESVKEVFVDFSSLKSEHGKVKVAAGDFIAVEVQAAGANGRRYFIVSFHGDSNGLLSIPVIDALHALLLEKYPNHCAVFCLDANVYAKAEKGKVDFASFTGHLASLGLTSCFGDSPDLSKCFTTCNARTSLQPQLNKAVPFADRATKSDKNPKDTIIFYKSQLAVVAEDAMGRRRQVNPMKDNTGNLDYKEGQVFPTLDFPSDHGIVGVVLR